MKGPIQAEKPTGVWKMYNQQGDLKGYYRPVYTGEAPSITDFQQPYSPPPPDTLKKAEPDIKLPRKKLRYFKKSKYLDDHYLIVSTNPLAPFVDYVPLGVEYFVNDRIGHELRFHLWRSPFFASHRLLRQYTLVSSGIQPRFYSKVLSPRPRSGLFYFGHTVRGQLFNYNSIAGTETISFQTQGAEYALVAGNRLIKQVNKRIALTGEIYGGVGIGYQQSNANKIAISAFGSRLSNHRIYPAFRLGFTLGVAFLVE